MDFDVWVQKPSGIAEQASAVLNTSGDTDAALGRMEASIGSANSQAKRITEQAQRVDTAMADFRPALKEIDNAVSGTTSGVEKLMSGFYV